MPPTPPINLSSSPAPATPKASLGDAAITIAGHKITTHTLAVALGVILSVAGPYLAQLWPQAAPAIDAAKKSLSVDVAAPACPCAPGKACSCVSPTLSDFEKQVRTAWATEKEAADVKAEKLRKLIYLYHRTAIEAETKWTDLAELNQSFHDSAARLGVDGQLALTRGPIIAEWSARITEKAPKPLTEPLRAKMSALLRETVGILERLPP
jgi:hypothetical protein